ncbi:MAG: ABC transporter ATP-binding protein [Peptococcaceae bacterium]|nr:ABC transporter ATP-binding protein [Peptococcaceae bacterium]
MNVQPFTKTYDGRIVLDFPGGNFTAGSITAIIGANGCGKSTFTKILAGVLQSDQHQRPVKTTSIGYMPQKNFAFRMTTRKNILLGEKNPTKADALMEALHLTSLADKAAHKLSGGETARMALARLMMKQYDLVLLDEPTAAMDMETTLLAETLIKHYVKETNCAFILVTHSLQQARRIADDVLFFKSGELCEHGPKEQVLYAPKNEKMKKFLDFYGV